VYRIKRVPVQQSTHAARLEDRCLSDLAARVVACNLELEPRPSGHFHFLTQPEHPTRLDRLYSPEIERVSATEANRVASATTQTRPTKKQIDRSTNFPEEIPVIPSRRSADSRDRSEGFVRSTRDGGASRIDDPESEIRFAQRLRATDGG